MPVPLSLTVIFMYLIRGRLKNVSAVISLILVQVISIFPPSGMAWQAFIIRFWITWLIWPVSISADQRSSGI